VAYPQDEDAITIDDQFFLGHDRSLLLKPVTSEGAKEVSVYLSDSEPFYDYFSGQLYKGPGRTAIPVTLETIPLLQRGGSIITRRDLVRRSAPLMWRDPITLVIALDSNGEAQGTLYTDDGETYDFEKGDYLWRSFEFKPTSKGKTATYALHSSDISGRPDNDWTRKSQPIVIRTIVVLGLPSEPKCIRDAASEIGLPFAWAAATTSTFKTTTHSSNLTIEDAELPLTKDWTLTFGSEACATAATTSRPLSSLQSDLCPPNHFRCENSGHKPACLLLSRVNDGICDPSCCDGSDEFDGKVECRNRCAEVGSLFRKERDESLRKHRVGAKQRDVYIKTGKQEKDRLEKELTQLQISLTTLESTSARLQAVLKDTEAQSAEEITRKKQSRLYRRLEEHQAAIRDLRQSRSGLRDDLDTLKRILDDLQKGYNPNYQDMAVKGAVKGFEEWQKEHGVIAADPSEEDGDEASPVPAGAEAVADKWSDAQLQELEGEDLLALIESSEISASQYEGVVNRALFGH
jgi:alpha 1,3-glucosidase